MLTRKTSLTLLLVFFSFVCYPQDGTVQTNLTLKSKILKGERNYAIYLPPNYETSKEKFPVLYLLHGAGDDHTGWIVKGDMKAITDKAITQGLAKPMVIVMPDAQTIQRGYFNAIHGNWNYEDFFFEEFIPHIEKTFKVQNSKDSRAVSGLSMGGGGSFMYAMHHPELFAAAAPLSAYVGPLSIEYFKKNFLGELSNNFSEEQIKEYYNYHNALSLVEVISPEKLSSVAWYIDCGDDDFLYEGNSRMHIAMRQKKIEHEYRVRDGAHDWEYWQGSLPEVLRFVSLHFTTGD